ncbi:SPFH domain-containing protein [Aeromicrobium sp. 179-A 4D2 NHS]|uniref:SPFH domain-containing protein n=1 Tax=Aeromicrobium sp. 179-A 4D2 NHS TaxID=3142375 RepID=UPI0039A1A11C
MPSTTMLLIGGLVIAVIAAVAFILNRLRIAGVSEAIIVSGSRNNGEVKVVSPGGKTFVMPIVQKASTISLSQTQVQLHVDAIDHRNIVLNIKAVAMIKVGSSPELIRAAAERFNGKEDQIPLERAGDPHRFAARHHRQDDGRGGHP